MVEPVELPSRLGILPFRNKVLLPGAIIRIRCTSSSRYASRMLLITSLFSCSVFSMDDFTLMQNHDVFSRPSNKFWFTSFWSLRFWPFLLFGNLVSLSLDHQFLAVSWCSHFFLKSEIPLFDFLVVFLGDWGRSFFLKCFDDHFSVQLIWNWVIASRIPELISLLGKSDIRYYLLGKFVFALWDCAHFMDVDERLTRKNVLLWTQC